MHRDLIPVWFFVGVLLAAFGVIIFASGLLEWSESSSTVLGELHAPVWWGAILTLIGLAYVTAFRPRKRG